MERLHTTTGAIRTVDAPDSASSSGHTAGIFTCESIDVPTTAAVAPTARLRKPSPSTHWHSGAAGGGDILYLTFLRS